MQVLSYKPGTHSQVGELCLPGLCVRIPRVEVHTLRHLQPSMTLTVPMQTGPQLVLRSHLHGQCAHMQAQGCKCPCSTVSVHTLSGCMLGTCTGDAAQCNPPLCLLLHKCLLAGSPKLTGVLCICRQGTGTNICTERTRVAHKERETEARIASMAAAWAHL